MLEFQLFSGTISFILRSEALSLPENSVPTLPNVQAKIPRRFFLRLGVTGALATATTSLSLLSELVPLQLTVEEEQHLILLALQNHTGLEFGEHPDFERQQLHGAMGTLWRAKELVPEMKYAGIFGYLEEFAFYPTNKDVLRQQILAIHEYGLIPLVGLGPGGSMSPHPLDVRNDEWLKYHVREWLEFLSSFDFPVHVRWIFETNIIRGDIAHGPTAALYGKAHEDRVKYVSEYFDTERKKEKYGNKIFYHAAFAAAGYDFRSYLADCDYDGLGLDVYPDIHGMRMVHYAIAKLLGWEYHTLFPHTMLIDLHEMSRMYGTNSYIYEYSPLHHIDWMKHLLLAHYALGGTGDLTFGINKSVAEGINWSISEEARQERVRLHGLLYRQRV